MSSAEREKWEQWPDLYVRLQKDELGYPPKEWEQLKGEPTGQENVYRIKSIPFYARGIAFDDEVATETSPEGYSPVVAKVVKRSGFSTMRISLSEKEDRNAIIQDFTRRGAFLEFNGRLVAVAIPRNVFDEVSDYICEEKDTARWDAEDGFLIVDDPNP
ncbi:MAG TPA: DUF4265 domain-containing protein [Terracidiphilus sp.]|nr:DUF4265 domain-containing protein [Terracidiphilus sp.]